jgi:hypothetical protein
VEEGGPEQGHAARSCITRITGRRANQGLYHPVVLGTLGPRFWASAGALCGGNADPPGAFVEKTVGSTGPAAPGETAGAKAGGAESGLPSVDHARVDPTMVKRARFLLILRRSAQRKIEAAWSPCGHSDGNV